MAGTPSFTRADAEDFLYGEARILDQRRFNDWLDLFTEDGVYWLPIDENAPHLEKVSLIYDDSQRRAERVYRLLETPAVAQMPPSRTQHFVTNIEVENLGEEVLLRSAQLIHELRSGDYRQREIGDHRSFAGTCEHHLRQVDGVWRIALKKLVLINREVPIPNLTMIL